MSGSSVRLFTLGAALALVPVLAAAQTGPAQSGPTQSGPTQSGSAENRTAQNGPIQLTLTDDGVTLITQNAAPRDILAEWTRVTGTKVVGAEGIGGAPVTLQLENVSERQALDAVLRSAAGGYMVADGSILIVPAKAGTPTRAAAASSAVAARAQPNRVPSTVTADPVTTDENIDSSYEDMAADMDVEMDEPWAAEETDWTETSSSPVPTAAGAAGELDQDETISPTDFDYANPQRYFEMRAQQMRQLQMQRQMEGGQGQGAADGGGGGIYVPGGSAGAQGSAGNDVAIVGGGNQPTAPAAQPTAPGMSDRPGVAPTQPTTPDQSGQQQQGQPNPRNPYGLPDGVVPGSQVPPPDSPAYQGRRFNPYEPSSGTAGQAGSGQSGNSQPDQK